MLTVFLVGKKYFSYEAGLVAWIVLLGTPHLFQINPAGYYSTHTLWSADPDSLHLFLLVASLFFFWKGLKNKKFFFVAIFLSALSFLAKGPFGFLPILIYLLFALINKKTVKLKPKELLLATGVILLTIIPWYLYQYIRLGDYFLEIHFLYHMLGRTVSVVEGHSAVFWIYIKQLSVPEVFFSFPLLIFSMINISLKKKLFTDFRYFSILSGFIISLATILVIQTKLSWYLFYVYPFAALLIGLFVHDILSSLYHKNVKLLTLFGVVSIIAFQVLSQILYFSNIQRNISTTSNFARSDLFYYRKTEGEIPFDSEFQETDCFEPNVCLDSEFVKSLQNQFAK
jgi:4-amino-4-deoxy-L-arabinose transferase-like glycosyltransferase